MLRSIKEIYKDKLGATDGEIGRVNDFYFDDSDWTVRYVVADTGTWTPGRLVLISPRALGDLYPGGRVLLVNLTRQQIENSPAIESHKPVSRKYEEEYHQYYNWPFYWQGDALWGMSGFPILSERSEPFLGEQATRKRTRHSRADAHLRSARTVTGYKIQAGDEEVGALVDFLVDDKTWAIRHLVINTGRWRSSKQVLISPRDVQRISWNESKVFVNLSKEAILKAPPYDDRTVGATHRTNEFFAIESLD